MATTRSTVMPVLRYKDAPAAIEWLCNVLGFARHVVYEGADRAVAHAELTLGGGIIRLGSTCDDAYGRLFRSPGEVGNVETRSTYVVVEDADEVYARATAAGATVIRPLQDTDYGSREFTVKDPEGHSWSVGTYDPWAVHA